MTFHLHTEMYLRKNCWLIGPSHSESLDYAIRLPTNKTVLARYVHFRSKSSTDTTRDIFQNIFSEMKVVWDKSGVPIRLDRYCVDNLLPLFQKWDCIQKIEKKTVLIKMETRRKRLKCFRVN